MSSVAGRLVVILALVVLAAAAFVTLGTGDRDPERRLETDYRAPVGNPPVEPDRPDLIEEPKIDE